MPGAERRAGRATASTRCTPPDRYLPTSTVTSASRGTCEPARWPAADTPGRPTAPPSGRAPTGAHGHEPDQYGDHTLHGLSDANEARLGARTRKQRDGRRQSNPTPPTPRHPPTDPDPTTPLRWAAGGPPATQSQARG